MDINIHNVTEIRITKTRNHIAERGNFAVRTIIITDVDGRAVTLDLVSDTANTLKVVNKDRWVD
tara:strand:+ start:179 stop:370 length:192 start_codon:yes stop_codon:yes gene_type:complete